MTILEYKIIVRTLIKTSLQNVSKSSEEILNKLPPELKKELADDVDPLMEHIVDRCYALIDLCK